MKKLLIVMGITLLAFASCKSSTPLNIKFIKVENGHFLRDGKPFYYIGTNYWYGAILGSKGKEGNRQRLIEELDMMKANGHTWNEFMTFSGTFHQCTECKELFRNHIKYMLGRTNQITGIPYSEDPTIMTWELANEPRAFSDANKIPFLNWVNETSAYIKSLDANHLVTTRTEGRWGCENDMGLFEKIHSSKNIDYLTMHIWPFNWSWINPQDIAGTMDKAIANTGKYMDDHLKVARKLNKPLVFEEFGLPRDGFVFTPGSPVTIRDKYYDFSFGRVLESAQKMDMMAGANFRAFSGTGKPNPARKKNMWQVGDDYLGDPPQEAQGLKSVFISDPTITIVKKYNEEITKAVQK